jgi:hypothetical protein
MMTLFLLYSYIIMIVMLLHYLGLLLPSSFQDFICWHPPAVELAGLRHWSHFQRGLPA